MHQQQVLQGKLNNYMYQNNVVQFPSRPGTNAKPIPQSEDERQANIKAYQTRMVLDTSIELSYQLFDEVLARGIDLTDSADIDQDMMMVCESIKAMMLRACGISHPLHKITEQVVNKYESIHFKQIWDQINRSDGVDLE